MPANTTRGWPYPLGTDRVADGDDAIHALASKLDDVVGYGIAAGTTTINITAVNTPASATVTFPVGRFAAPPVCTATIYAGGNVSPYAPLALNTISAAAVNITAVRSSGTGVFTVHWIATLPG